MALEAFVAFAELTSQSHHWGLQMIHVTEKIYDNTSTVLLETARSDGFAYPAYPVFAYLLITPKSAVSQDCGSAVKSSLQLSPCKCSFHLLQALMDMFPSF